MVEESACQSFHGLVRRRGLASAAVHKILDPFRHHLNQIFRAILRGNLHGTVGLFKVSGVQGFFCLNLRNLSRENSQMSSFCPRRPQSIGNRSRFCPFSRHIIRSQFFHLFLVFRNLFPVPKYIQSRGQFFAPAAASRIVPLVLTGYRAIRRQSRRQRRGRHRHAQCHAQNSFPIPHSSSFKPSGISICRIQFINL